MIDPQTDERIIHSLIHLNRDPLAMPFVDWLKNSLSADRVAMDNMITERDIRITQGSNLCLNNIITNIEKAFETLQAQQKNTVNAEKAGRVF